MNIDHGYVHSYDRWIKGMMGMMMPLYRGITDTFDPANIPWK